MRRIDGTDKPASAYSWGCSETKIIRNGHVNSMTRLVAALSMAIACSFQQITHVPLQAKQEIKRTNVQGIHPQTKSVYHKDFALGCSWNCLFLQKLRNQSGGCPPVAIRIPKRSGRYQQKKTLEAFQQKTSGVRTLN